MRCFDVILMLKPRWPPISRYEIVKTSAEKYDNTTKLISLFTYPILALSATNPPPSSTANHCARPVITIYNNSEHTYHFITIRYVTVNNDIQKFRKQTKAEDVSLCCVIITLFYITLTLQIMLITVTYLDISVSNIPLTRKHGLFCVCLQPIRACVVL